MSNITIKLNNLNDATNKFNENVLSNELATYIEENSKYANNEDISLTIIGLEDKDHELLNTLIHNYYLNKVKDLNKIDKYDDYFRFILLLLGIILIIISEQLTLFLSELFLIAGWVVVWEVVYDILFTGIKRKRKLKIVKKLANCKINYKNKIDK